MGGCVRDALLGRPVADVDVITSGDPAVAAKALSRAHGASRFELSQDFGAWRLTGGTLPWQVDIMPMLGETLDEDLRRRDFTVNALALSVSGNPVIVDHHGGMDDLSRKRLVLVAPAALTDDPVRVIRLARLADSLGFTVDPDARAAAHAAAGGLLSAPGERVMEEFSRIIRADDPVAAIAALDDVGGLTALIPELGDCRGVEQSTYHHLDVLGHTFEVLGNVARIERDPAEVFRGNAPMVAVALRTPLADGFTCGDALRITALLHDMAKAQTRGVTDEGHDRVGADMADALMRRLRTSNRLREFVVHGVRQHLVLGFLVHRQPLSLVQYDRYLRRVAPDPIEAIVLSVADRLATDGPRTTPTQITRHLALARDILAAHARIDEMEPIRSVIDGAKLAELLARRPGPWVAELLIAIREERLMGRLGDVAATERFGRDWDAANPDAP